MRRSGLETDFHEFDWYYEGNTEVLCAERVGQMTKTYSDIDAVTRLLEEKERDLELAAQIGQSLLKRNQKLVEQNEHLEERVGHIQEEVSQLQHELTMKDELLHFYTSAADESDGDSSSASPIQRNRSAYSMPGFFPMDSLQKKLKDLELENIVLRSEASHLRTETISFEEKEHQLVNDCVKELRESSLQITTIAEELAKKTEDASRQQEEITHLLSQIVDLQKKAKSCAVENEELSQHLAAAKDAQRQLTAELQELEEKYAECIEMLHEAQEELKNLRNKSLPNCTPRRFQPLGLFPMDSLAAEIEGTMRKEMQMDAMDADEEQTVRHRRVFDTVKNINQTVKPHHGPPLTASIPGSNQSSPSLVSVSSSGRDAETGSPGDSACDSNKRPTAPPPGSQDLELALRRLSLRRENFLSERRFFREDRERKLLGLSDEGAPGAVDSVMSLGGPPGYLYVYGARSYLPDKLQIVKPLEGSATLHHWQQLAQPNLGGILDSRPGVVPKGFRPLELDLEEVYPFADFEEDESGLPTTSTSSAPLSRSAASACSSPSSLSGHQPSLLEAPVNYPGKCMCHTSSTYTFTTCRILHPSDELTRVTPSLNMGPMSTSVMASSLKSTPAVTPCTPRRLSLAESFTNLRDSTKTMSTSLGLVRLLQERGISAAVYNPQSWDRAGSGVVLSTSAQPQALHPLPSTPPNSPTSRALEAPFDFQNSRSPYDNFLASRPAGFILKEVTAEARNQADCESQTDVSIYNLNLVDKLKRFGVAGPRARGAVSMLGPLSQPGIPFALSADLRRNRSYPSVVGASMAMKGPGPQGSEVLLASKLPRQGSLK